MMELNKTRKLSNLTDLFDDAIRLDAHICTFPDTRCKFGGELLRATRKSHLLRPAFGVKQCHDPSRSLDVMQEVEQADLLCLHPEHHSRTQVNHVFRGLPGSGESGVGADP